MYDIRTMDSPQPYIFFKSNSKIRYSIWLSSVVTLYTDRLYRINSIPYEMAKNPRCSFIIANALPDIVYSYRRIFHFQYILYVKTESVYSLYIDLYSLYLCTMFEVFETKEHTQPSFYRSSSTLPL